MSKTIIYLVSAILLVCSCTTTKQYVKKSNEEKFIVNISIERINNKTWQIKYKLPLAVHGLKFYRQTNKFRHEMWSTPTKNLSIEVTNGSEIIYSKTKEKFKEFIITHKTYSKNLMKDYELFFKYTDGSLLLYTGHYYIQPMYFEKPESLKPEALTKIKNISTLHQITFTPSKNEFVAFPGHQSNTPIKWTDETGRGTYAYFGRIKPIETNEIIAVVDPGLPKWLLKKYKPLLTKLFSFYKNKTGYALNFKPTVYFHYADKKKEGLGNTGNVLPGLVQLGLEGKDWEKESKDAFEHIFKFLAHESAHFWNGRMFNKKDSENSIWMHEGGAEIFAYRTALDLGITNKNKFLNSMNYNLQKCILGLSGISVNQSVDHRKFRNYYSCGTIIGLISEAAINQKNENNMIYDLWKNIFKTSENNNRTYSQKTYLSVLENMGNSSTSSKIKEFVEIPQNSLTNFLMEALSEVGIKSINKTKNFSKNYQLTMGIEIMKQIMKQDCNFISFNHGKNNFGLQGNNKCKSIKTNYKVSHIGKYHVRKEGVLAYDHAFKTCNSKGYIFLKTTSNNKIKTHCKNIKTRKAPLEIINIKHLNI